MLVTIVRDIWISNNLFKVGTMVEITDDMFNRCGTEYFSPAPVKPQEPERKEFISELNKMVTTAETKRPRGRPLKRKG